MLPMAQTVVSPVQLMGAEKWVCRAMGRAWPGSLTYPLAWGTEPAVSATEPTLNSMVALTSLFNIKGPAPCLSSDT